MEMPEPVVAAFLPLAHLRVARGIHEARMRIERLQHAGDGAVDRAVGRSASADVVLLDRAQRRGEDLVLLGNLVLGDSALAAEDAAEHGAQQTTDEHRGRDRTGTCAYVENVHPCLDPVQIGFL